MSAPTPGTPFKRPFHIALLAGLVVVLAGVLVAWLGRPASNSARFEAEAGQGLPWQVESPDATRLRVFGLTIGASRLGEARERWGEDLQVAVIASRVPGRDAPALALEAHVERIEAGFVVGRMVLTGVADRGLLEAVAGRPARTEPTASGARRLRPAAADLPALLDARLGGITFVPAARLEEAVVLQRFGVPAERVRGDDGAVHLLYPTKGLVVTLGERGQAVLHYVAPGEFEARLAQPLRAGGVAGAMP